MWAGAGGDAVIAGLVGWAGNMVWGCEGEGGEEEKGGDGGGETHSGVGLGAGG